MAQQRYFEGEKLLDYGISEFRNKSFTESLIQRFNEWDSDSVLNLKMKRDIDQIQQINDVSPGLGLEDTKLLEQEYLTHAYYQIITLLVTGKCDNKSHARIPLESIEQILQDWGFKPKSNFSNSSARQGRVHASRFRIQRDGLPLQPADDFTTTNGLSLMEALIDGAPNWFVTLMLSEVAKGRHYRRNVGPHSRT